MLPYADAIAAIAGDDPRPLLVLRDCLACKGEDHAVLKRDKLNDRTYLLTGWFHCVKLPEHVTDYRHPFHNLFSGDNPPHLFLCLADGKGRVDLSGGQSQSDTWNTLTELARSAYKDNVDLKSRDLVRMLDQFDRVDAELSRLYKSLDVELERNGNKGARVPDLRNRVCALEAERQKLVQQERELRSLPLAKGPEPATPAAK